MNAPNNTPVTDAEVEAIFNGAEDVSDMLATHGPRHMLGVLSVSMAIAYLALGMPREEAIESAASLVGGAMDMYPADALED